MTSSQRRRDSLSRHANFQVVVGLASVGVGVLLVFGPPTSLFRSYNSTIAEAFWSADALPPQAHQLNHWLLATVGAGVIGWGLAWAAIAHIPFRAGERWAWTCLLITLLAWSSIDIGVALWFGVWGEVVFVLSALVAALVPLMIAAPLFRGAQRQAK